MATEHAPCPVCGREYVLTKAGTIRHHYALGAGLNNWACEGVGQVPLVDGSADRTPLDREARIRANERAKVANEAADLLQEHAREFENPGPPYGLLMSASRVVRALGQARDAPEGRAARPFCGLRIGRGGRVVRAPDRPPRRV